MVTSEDFLHYLWKFRGFDLRSLKTVSGLPVKILFPGYHNSNAGPDFEDARIKIGDTAWAGNIEIHLNSSDWEKHNHNSDEAYENVILHVVLNYDKQVCRRDGTLIETLELKSRIPEQIESSYTDLVSNLNWIPCASIFRGIDNFHVATWLSRVLIERLEQKSGVVINLLNEYKGSWDDAFYVMLARNFGFKTNALPFEMLARSLPQQLFAKHRNNPFQIESLIFGQSGLLDMNIKPTDKYSVSLKKEYDFLSAKYNLKPIDGYLWKFMRLRPQNFPTIRLAQFAALVVKSNHLFSKIIEIRDVSLIKELFSALPVNDYWNSHFRFNKPSALVFVQMGENSINNILLNTVSLFLFTYGKFTGKESFINRAVSLLENLPYETNRIIRGFTEIGFMPGKADRSQALLQLKKYYCDQKKCLHCGIGIKLINRR